MRIIFRISFIVSMSLTSCETKDIEVQFRKIENNTALFDIVNNSNKNIGKMTFEINYLDNSNIILLTDTVDYQMSEEYQKDNVAFLKAKEETFIAQQIPKNCTKANIEILAIENIKAD